MIDMFDTLGRSLNDLISNHENNNVEHAVTQLFADGGFASVDDREPSYAPSIRSQIAADNRSSSVSSPDFNMFGGRETNYYNSPEGLTQRIASGWGHFFSPQMNSGGTNAPMQKPGKSKSAESTDPEVFYAKFYNRLRNFAQADEIANRGQPQVRTR